VEAQWLNPSEEIIEGAISREDYGFSFLDSQGFIMIDSIKTILQFLCNFVVINASF
jgi:hypothetical protein